MATITELATFLKRQALKARGDDKAQLLEAAATLSQCRFARPASHAPGLIKLRCPVCHVPIVTKP